MHALIVGITESGKSTLAKALARMFHSAGRPVLAVNPLSEPGWSGHVTRDPARALDYAQHHLVNAQIFLDEAGDYLTNHKESRPYQWFLRQARHRGHSTWMITQEAQLIIKAARSQAKRLYAFAQSRADAEILAREWNKPELIKLPDLNQGELFVVNRFGPPQQRRLF